MTNVELIAKIKAEIERLYNGEAPKHDQQCNFDDGYFVGIDAIAQFLDSLESEKPMDQDELEKEIDRIWNPRFNLGWDDNSLLSINHKSFEAIARHFAQWGAEHLKK